MAIGGQFSPGVDNDLAGPGGHNNDGSLCKSKVLSSHIPPGSVTRIQAADPAGPTTNHLHCLPDAPAGEPVAECASPKWRQEEFPPLMRNFPAETFKDVFWVSNAALEPRSESTTRRASRPSIPNFHFATGSGVVTSSQRSVPVSDRECRRKVLQWQMFRAKRKSRQRIRRPTSGHRARRSHRKRTLIHR